ncbi:MAG TPA: protein-glutamate O-methyltransferase CheR [Frankiaceae bacterium]|jgi:chemotaxis protein methyltransferase CheR|nr:protein-glutamate O-methyltransferase CheR [Frankiaceae bacterium]
MTASMRPDQGSTLHDVARLVRAACGLVVEETRRGVLATLVHGRCAHLGIDDAERYLDRIQRDPAELQTLIEGLTIGETYFSRNPPQIRALAELVLPSLLARGDHRIRIWCAGCSTGEEPYTIALLLAKLLPEGAADWDVRVIGTDINTAALAAAREGRYGPRAVSLLDDEDLLRYFVRDGSGWRVGPQLRSLVEFRQHNLTTDPPPAPRLDLVLCRNVLIYFDRRQMLDVVDGMHNALVSGGWLLLGHSETLWRLYDGFELVRHDDAFLYRRRPPEPAAVRRPPPLRRPLAPPAPRPDPLAEVRDALSAGAYAAAAELAARHMVEQPLSAQLHYLHGLALVEIGEDAQALIALRRAAYLDPASGFAQFLLAVVLGRLGHGSEAARAYGAAALALSRRVPHERANELGGRRVEDLAAMCQQLARGPLINPLQPAEIVSR